jgi:2-polyprenyl-3-methyl-5-hydroxy-6-metoxy-1,4-benzoquinol methylase
VNRKQRRAEGKTGRTATGRVPNPLEDTLFREALAHHQAGRMRDAEAGYRNVLTLNARHAGALGFLGLLAHQAGHGEAGLDLLRKAVAADRHDAELHYNLAGVLSDHRRDDEAIQHYRKALELRPDFVDARTNLGALLLLRGRPADALAVVVPGLQDAAGEPLRSIFVMALRVLDPAAVAVEPALLRGLVRALTEPWCRPRDLSQVAGALLLRDAAMARSVARAARGAPCRPDELFSAGDLSALARDGLLFALLASAPVTVVAIEDVLTLARRALLDDSDAASAAPSEGWLALASAIAQQCFINEYVFAVTDDEAARVARLGAVIADALAQDQPIDPLRLAVLAAYRPLHAIAGAERLAARAWPEPVQALIRQQIAEPETEQAIRPQIERLTPVTDDVSQKVQAQYEENPYPRWSRVVADGRAMPVDRYIGMRFPGAPYRPLGGRAPDILIAGCGTGMHAIQRAQQFVGANVTAIDLSLWSISYAIRKTREIGLANIRYAQADILALEGDPAFDIIDSSGVLHHLGDPLAGWRRLAGLLRPGGLMHIGLYSRIARRDVNAVRERLAQQGRSYSPAEVRRLRAEARAAALDDPLHGIMSFSDFFSMSECRDLLFHVQEHQFTIPEIAAFLAEAGFTFIGFETLERDAYLRRFPDDPAAADLANWAAFESENPSAFAQMYQFWIQKA